MKLRKRPGDAGQRAGHQANRAGGPPGQQADRRPAPKIEKELYLAVLLDRGTSRPVLMASTEGGMDIEEVAAKTPEKIFKEVHRSGGRADALPGAQSRRRPGLARAT